MTPRCVPLAQGITTGGSWPSKGHSAMWGDICGCHKRGLLLPPSGERPGLLLNILRCTRQVPTTQSARPQVSPMSRLRASFSPSFSLSPRWVRPAACTASPLGSLRHPSNSTCRSQTRDLPTWSSTSVHLSRTLLHETQPGRPPGHPLSLTSISVHHRGLPFSLLSIFATPYCRCHRLWPRLS